MNALFICTMMNKKRKKKKKKASGRREDEEAKMTDFKLTITSIVNPK